MPVRTRPPDKTYVIPDISLGFLMYGKRRGCRVQETGCPSQPSLIELGRSALREAKGTWKNTVIAV